jgi:hypothetical protein
MRLLQHGQEKVKTVSAMAVARAAILGARCRCATRTDRQAAGAGVMVRARRGPRPAHAHRVRRSVTAEKKPIAEGTAPAPVRRVPASLSSRDPSRDGDGTVDEAREPMLRARDGDVEAFRQLVEMFQDRVMRVMVSVLHCDRSFAARAGSSRGCTRSR